MKYIKLLLVLVLTALMMPSFLHAAEKVKVSDYETLNLKETLAAEEIEEEFTSYSEKDDQITIYLFRGQGCGYCRAFLTFLNGITEEYGKYFKLVSFEVWNDSANGDLMTKLSSFLGKQAQGVPYIVIGDQTFPGYASAYDDSIKEAIVSEYEKSSKDRYDLIEEYNKSLKGSTTDSSVMVIMTIVNIIIAVAAVVFIEFNQNKKFTELETLIEKKSKK